MNAAIYNQATGKIERRIAGAPEAMLLQVGEGEELYLNCPNDATHIVEGKPLRIDPEPPTPTPIAEIKAKQKTGINVGRDTTEAAGFDYIGKRFDSDAKAIARILTTVAAAQEAPDDFTIEWTLQDNTTTIMTKAELVMMPVAMAMAGKAIHQRARDLKDQIDAAITAEEVQAITWTFP